MADNAEIVRQTYGAWNNRDFDFMSQHSAADFTLTMVGSGSAYHGAEGARQYAAAWAEAFPDGRITVDNVISEGNYVVVEFTGRGTHTGTLVTPAGEIPPTGRSATLHFLDVHEFDGDLIRAQRTYFDTGSLIAQLGVPQAPASAV
jgi:steroid delta-isomerase-like uncharacterized protein